MGLCLVPIYQFFWFFVVAIRFTERCNSFAKSLSVNQRISKLLSIIVATLVMIPTSMLYVGVIIEVALFFSENPKSQGRILFFVLPQIMTLINFLLAIPMLIGSASLVLNACYDKQIEMLMGGQHGN